MLDYVDLVLLPHCDLHIALGPPGVPALRLTVLRRSYDSTLGTYVLDTNVTGICAFEFFAPYLAPGLPGGPPVLGRFANLPTVATNGEVSATTPGVYLFRVRLDREYIVGRLQVHQEVKSWWFGSDSITAAYDSDPYLTDIAQAQPSIYARFSDDGTPPTGYGTDLVGDITGHDYVALSSADPTTFVVADGPMGTPSRGRLLGIAETAGNQPAKLYGSFLGHPETLDVHVVEYSKARLDLDNVQINESAYFTYVGDRHNMLFLAEGFRDTKEDRDRFDEIVTQVTHDMFGKSRHQPYPMLDESINVFKAFSVSRQHAVTCGYQVTEKTVEGIPAGSPVPYEWQIPYHRNSGDKNRYTVAELVQRVGLPQRGESRDWTVLLPLWASQSLRDFQPERVDRRLVDAWKAQRCDGIVQARDTFFGLCLGHRLADRSSVELDDPVPAAPKADKHSPQLSQFVAQLYQFYDIGVSRLVLPDPRRHPPELYAAADRTDPANAILRYISGLRHPGSPKLPFGSFWLPEPRFKPSRGLVALIVNDDMDGGTNMNNNTLTATTTGVSKVVQADYDHPSAPPGAKGRLRRRLAPPGDSDDLDDVVDTVAHEFGHSFNLGDEYEYDGDPSLGTDAALEDVGSDNVARLGFIRDGSPPSRAINPDKVKWLRLPRVRFASRLTASSTNVPPPGLLPDKRGVGIEVTVDPEDFGQWERAHADKLRVNLRNTRISATGQQLPFLFTDDQYLVQLDITFIDPQKGKIVLGGPMLPPAPFPQFAAESVIFAPLLDRKGEPLHVVEPDIVKYLNANHVPLNSDLNQSGSHTYVNRDVDTPLTIKGFGPPCKSKWVIGVYEGAHYQPGGYYRPAGSCKMRSEEDTDFCYVCKWLIVNRVDPNLLGLLDWRHYPEAKEHG